MITMLHADCMEFMRGQPDGAFDLAIVDPPYGIGKRLSQGSGKLNGISLQRMDSKWDVAPTPEYFSELFRVSDNQIIWGGNYFPLPPTRGVICWDKCQAWENFSQWEMAWTSFDKPASLFQLHDGGFMQTEGANIHPTQKPVALYKWILTRYAKPGWKILDTHGGSGSDCIAAHDLGFDLTWMELDADYYAAAVARYQTHAAQLHLFDPAKKDEPENLPLDL